MADLKSQFDGLSRDIAQCEQVYRDLGLIYWALPSSPRDELINGTWQNIHHSFAATGSEPGLIMSLNQARQLKDEVRTALRREDLQAAQNKSMIAGDVFEDVKDSLVNLDFVVGRTKLFYDERWHHDWPDAGLPGTVQQQPEKYPLVRAWVLRLPEVQKALELRIVDEQQAFEMTIREDEDRVNIDDVEDSNHLPVNERSGMHAPPPIPAQTHRDGAYVSTTALLAVPMRSSLRTEQSGAEQSHSPRQVRSAEGAGDYVEPERLPGAWEFR